MFSRLSSFRRLAFVAVGVGGMSTVLASSVAPAVFHSTLNMNTVFCKGTPLTPEGPSLWCGKCGGNNNAEGECGKCSASPACGSCSSSCSTKKAKKAKKPKKKASKGWEKPKPAAAKAQKVEKTVAKAPPAKITQEKPVEPACMKCGGTGVITKNLSQNNILKSHSELPCFLCNMRKYPPQGADGLTFKTDNPYPNKV